MSLTQKKAEDRTKWIRQNTIEYDFHLILNEGPDFHGLAEISFYLDSAEFESLPLDFSCKKVHALQVNQIPIESDLSEERLLLIKNQKHNGKNLLHRGKNRVTVLYSGDYDTSGEGCVTYTQTGEDGKKSQFLYTQFEAYCANMVFPCFDQPDLKAPMKLTIVAPSIWKILSNEYPENSSDFSKQSYLQKTRIHGHSKHLLPQLFEFVPKDYLGTYITTIFPATKLLPTYLYCFIAGDYQEIKCTLPHNLPFQLSIYSISSYKPYLQNLSNFIFDVTIESMKFYQEFFGYPYSFPKFDQVWVHEFRAGAMENAGIVTYNDADLYKEKNPTSVQLVELADTITHQLSHHWFGNLVTMKWWDDLWLNQSFADFISYFCIEKIKNKLQYKVDSALSIFRDREMWGYREDSRNLTTHPIRAPVHNTAETDSIFDGITYSKGGACLQQLLSLMGEQNFSKSLSNYFNRFEWSNASIDDFLEEMSFNFKETEFTLDQWKEMWLMTPSLNVFSLNWENKEGAITVNLKQGLHCEKFTTLRFRRVEVALFNQKAEIFQTLSLLIQPKEEQVFEEKVNQTVCAVLYNHNDQDYSDNIIDATSLSFFEQHLPKIDNLLSRTVLWYNLLAMGERAAYPIPKLVHLVDKYIFEEKIQFLFENILFRVRNTITQNLPLPKRQPLFSLLFKHIYSELTSGKVFGQERTNILKNELISYASSDEDKMVLLKWLEGKEEQIKGVELDIVAKWSIARKVFTADCLQLQEKKRVFDSIAHEDSSDKKTEEAHVYDAIVADKEHFEELYQKLRTEDKSVSMSVKKMITAGWRNMVHYEWLSKEYKDKYYNDLFPLSGTLSYLHYQHFYRMLKPLDDDIQDQIDRYWGVVKQLQEKVDESGDAKIHAKEIKKIIDDLQKKLRNYQFNS